MFSAFEELPSTGVSRYTGDNHGAVTLVINEKQFSDTEGKGTGGERNYVIQYFVLFLILQGKIKQL